MSKQRFVIGWCGHEAAFCYPHGRAAVLFASGGEIAGIRLVPIPMDDWRPEIAALLPKISRAERELLYATLPEDMLTIEAATDALNAHFTDEEMPGIWFDARGTEAEFRAVWGQ